MKTKPFVNCVFCTPGQEVCSTCVRKSEISKDEFIAACVKEVQELKDEEVEY